MDNETNHQRGFISSIEKLNKTLNKLNKDSLKENTAKTLNDNMADLSKEMAKNFQVIKDYKQVESPILTAVKENLRDKKDNIKDKLKGTNIFRKMFGIKEGSGTLMDAIVDGFEARGQNKNARKSFRKDYAKFNKQGQEDSQNLSRSEFNKKSDALFNEIEKKNAELASANADVLRGVESEFGRATDADLDRQALLEQELALLKSAGFGDTPAEQDEAYRVNQEAYESETLMDQENDERKEEAAKKAEEQTDLLRTIAENTGGKGSVDPNEDTKKSSKGGLLTALFGGMLGGAAGGGILGMGKTLLGGLFKGLKVGLLSVFKILFSPKKMLAVFSKVFVPIMIVGSLINGIMDGFKEWQESGSLKEALIAGLGGVLEFLSFGIFDKETIRKGLEGAENLATEYIIEPFTKMLEWISDSFNSYIIEPITNAVNKIKGWKDSLVEWVSGLISGGISGAKKFLFGDPDAVLPQNQDSGKIRKSTTSNKPLLPVSAVTNSVLSGKDGGTTVVNNIVNAPTTANSQVTNNHIKLPTRNPESSFMNMTRGTYAL